MTARELLDEYEQRALHVMANDLPDMTREARDLCVGNVIRAGSRVGMITSIDIQVDAVFAVVKDGSSTWICSWSPRDLVTFSLIDA